MSVQAISWVLDHSEARLGPRLVLLSIANHAKADGTGAWPAVEVIAQEAGLSRREVQYALRGLEELGEVATELRAGPRGRSLYSLPKMGRGAKSAPQGGEKSAPQGRKIRPTAPIHEPSNNRPMGRSPNATRRDLLFEAIMEVSGILLSEIPDAARGRYGKAVSTLRGLGASPEEVRRRAGHAWFQVTPSSLASRWAEIRRPPGRNGKPGIDWEARAKRAAELDAKEDAEREEAERAAKRG